MMNQSKIEINKTSSRIVLFNKDKERIQKQLWQDYCWNIGIHLDGKRHELISL